MWCSKFASPSSALAALVLLLGCEELAPDAGALESDAQAPPEDAGPPPPALSRAELLDPATCKGCHPRHYREWQSSMHAYASVDPVFRAMNQRGQRETSGALGDFCVRCHAPMALREGASLDGLNLDELPSSLQGVTCYFCHNVTHTGAEPFNNQLELADDTTMRGAIADPVHTGAHRSAYSPHQDRNRGESSALCGSCHDVVTPNGVQLERTFAEYKDSLFAHEGLGFDTCSGCHMPGRPGRVAENTGAGSPQRTVHEHLWPGVDVALTEFPDREVQERAVECALGLNARIYAIGLSGVGELSIKVETQAGHHQPSGTAQDRRLWLEVSAFDERDQLLFQSGQLRDDQLEEKAPGDPGYDPNLALFRDWIYDAKGQPAHMFWDAAPSPLYPEGYVSLTLPAALRLNTPHTLEVRYRIPGFTRVKRVRVRLRMRPIGIDVLEDLVRSGDLDPALIAAMPTFTLHGAAEDWYPSDGARVSLWPDELECPDAYRCLLDADCP